MPIPSPASTNHRRPRSTWHPGVAGALALMLLVGACASAASSPATSGPAGTSRPTPPAEFPVGEYTRTITKDDLQAVGMTDPGLLNENAGEYTQTWAADGSWSVLQTSLDGSPVLFPVARGSYLVEGDELRMATEFPPEFAGTMVYRWSVSGDELTTITISDVEGLEAQLAEVSDTKPWIRKR